MASRIYPQSATCAVTKCSRPIIAHGLCRSHYIRNYNWGDLKADIPIGQIKRPRAEPLGLSTKLCECGCGQFTRLISKNHTATNRKKGEPERFIQGHAAAMATRIYTPGQQCVATGCNRTMDEPGSAKGYCNTHYQRLRAWGKIRDDWPIGFRLKAAGRSRYIRGRTQVLQFLCDRDGRICGICGNLVIEASGPLGPSIDHVIPFARGGSHEPENLQLAHLHCNWEKNDSLLPSILGHLGKHDDDALASLINSA